MLADVFDGRMPLSSIDTDEAVTHGAAIQGGILSGESGEETRDLILLDVTPLTLNVEVAGGKLEPISPRNTVIPTRRRVRLTTATDEQDVARLSIYEGERAASSRAHHLGSLTLHGLPAAAHVELELEIDADGILRVAAHEAASGVTERLTITNDVGRLSQEEVERMVSEAEAHHEDDKAAVLRWHDRHTAWRAVTGKVGAACSFWAAEDAVTDTLCKDEMVLPAPSEMLTDELWGREFPIERPGSPWPPRAPGLSEILAASLKSEL